MRDDVYEVGAGVRQGPAGGDGREMGGGAMTAESAKKSRLRFLPYVIFAALALWVAAEVFFINNDPEPGASSPKALEEQVLKAARNGDDDGLKQLFVKDSVADDYAKDYLDRLNDAEPRGLKVSVRGHGDAEFLTLTGESGKSGGPAQGGALCTSWQVESEDGRWLLDGTPPVETIPCGG
ncbi:hypothetical protein ACFU99_29495 [Streptomyces sp. NPDC057654]|uniref:hypothetical protein n=1 Tax=Streptomyces sp. NPDC057654 TaxID=3346196 RepID=UPI0036961D90